MSQSLLFLILTLTDKLEKSSRADSLILKLSYACAPVNKLGCDSVEQKT